MALVPGWSTPCEVPADFDQKAYHAVATRASTFSEKPSWGSYAGGFNGVAFRSTAAEEAHERFVYAISGADAFSPAGPRYIQEEALFAFFVNALSALECFYFAMHNLAACLAPAHFPVSSPAELRRIHIASVVKCFQAAYPADLFTSRLASISTTSELLRLREYRDVLTHRGAPARKHYIVAGPDRRIDLRSAKSATIASNPKDIPTAWVSDLALTPAMTTEPRSWLVRTLNELLADAAVFLDTHAQAPRPASG